MSLNFNTQGHSRSLKVTQGRLPRHIKVLKCLCATVACCVRILISKSLGILKRLSWRQILVVILLLSSFLYYSLPSLQIRKVYSLTIFPNSIYLIVGIGVNTSEIIFFSIGVHPSFFSSILGHMVYFI